MSEGNIAECPKCGGKMESGNLSSSGGVRIRKLGDWSGDLVQAYYCRECGFIELYKEPSTKEPWRLPKEEAPLTEEPPLQQQKEEKPPKPSRRLIR